MNDLQITLLVVGGGGIVAMIAYNWWQDYRLRKQASERFGQSDEDPLLNKPRGKRAEPGFEPSMNSAGDDGFPTEDGSFENPVGDPIDSPQMADSADEVLSNTPAEQLDRKLFVDFTLRFEAPKDANSWKSLMDGLEQIKGKRVVYAASPQADQTAAADETLWFKAYPYAGNAAKLRISLQIANRKGPLSAIEFSEVLSKLRRYAEQHEADLDFPDMKEVVSKAETLDQAAAALDTLLGLHCLLPESVSDAQAATALANAGWQQRGHQWLFADDTGPLATMVIHNAPGKRLLSFSIDVPNSADPVKALGEIVTFCHGLNEAHGAPLMDDSGRVLGTQAIEGIYNTLIERVRNLQDAGFKPGSPLARALFS